MQLRFVVLMFMILTVQSLSAQTGELMVQGTTPNLHLQHAVAPKENWYSIGRLYNISPKEIAPYNGAQLENTLSIGQQIKIPLTPVNFSQDQNKAGDEVFVPVYHVVQDQEWMYRVSSNFNKVPVESLEKWNGITRDQAKPGMKLIVGYLKVKRSQSALAGQATEVPAGAMAGTQPGTRPASEQSDPEERKEVQRPVEDTQTMAAKEPAVQSSNQTPKATLPPENSGQTTPPVTAAASANTGDGYFTSMYQETGKNTSGTAGLFKSTSGWQDGKYYALMNDVAIGAIVKVTNTANNKTVYAKVLGQVPEMKESVGLAIRISDAAAAHLGATTPKFPVQIHY